MRVGIALINGLLIAQMSALTRTGTRCCALESCRRYLSQDDTIVARAKEELSSLGSLIFSMVVLVVVRRMISLIHQKTARFKSPAFSYADCSPRSCAAVRSLLQHLTMRAAAISTMRTLSTGSPSSDCATSNASPHRYAQRILTMAGEA